MHLNISREIENKVQCRYFKTVATKGQRGNQTVCNFWNTSLVYRNPKPLNC